LGAEAWQPSPEHGEDRLLDFLRARHGAGLQDTALAPLSGDASTRRYYRFLHEGESTVLALYPEPFRMTELPFAVVGALLAGFGLPVPKILGFDEERGVLVLEDLGDLRLQDVLPLLGEDRRLELYREATQDIRTLQREAALAPRDKPCFGVAFDAEKLTWELDYFRQHFLEGWRRCQFSADERSTLDEGFGSLSAEIAGWPRVLCHRDYHSRNLMLCAERLVWIDFQDARMGPATYDLASLLRDPYVDLPEELVSELAEVFRQDTVPDESPATFGRRFDLMSLQRNFKALGTFGYQAIERDNTVYVSYMPRALSCAGRILRRHAELAPLHRVLARQIQELQ
jgi:aminoglycoside/choline kinase family phosphotransferase